MLLARAAAAPYPANAIEAKFQRDLLNAHAIAFHKAIIAVKYVVNSCRNSKDDSFKSFFSHFALL